MRVFGVAAKIPLTHVVSLHYGVSASPSAPVSEYIVIVDAAQPD
ncbi:MAG TPA: hypothetical protein VGC79_37310 [Polyangiaceae bacterium]